MKIIPLSELRNTSAVSKMVTEDCPIFFTKQGREHIVMLSQEMYDKTDRENRELKEYVKILEADLEILKNGKSARDFDDFIEDLKNV